MSRITSVTLLLIMLVDTFYGHTASQAGFHVSKVHIRKCRCRVFANGRIQCRYPPFPSSHKEQQNVIKCFCSRTSQRKCPGLKAACTTWRPGFPISLV